MPPETTSILRYKPNLDISCCKCKTCRFANQNTSDFRGGFIFCSFVPGVKSTDSTCDVILKGKDNSSYLLYEKYNNNCLWESNDDIVVFSGDYVEN